MECCKRFTNLTLDRISAIDGRLNAPQVDHKIQKILGKSNTEFWCNKILMHLLLLVMLSAAVARTAKAPTAATFRLSKMTAHQFKEKDSWYHALRIQTATFDVGNTRLLEKAIAALMISNCTLTLVLDFPTLEIQTLLLVYIITTQQKERRFIQLIIQETIDLMWKTILLAFVRIPMLLMALLDALQMVQRAA